MWHTQNGGRFKNTNVHASQWGHEPQNIWSWMAKASSSEPKEISKDIPREPGWLLSVRQREKMASKIIRNSTQSHSVSLFFNSANPNQKPAISWNGNGSKIPFDPTTQKGSLFSKQTPPANNLFFW